jgi:hypothetical protein
LSIISSYFNANFRAAKLRFYTIIANRWGLFYFHNFANIPGDTLFIVKNLAMKSVKHTPH